MLYYKLNMLLSLNSAFDWTIEFIYSDCLIIYFVVQVSVSIEGGPSRLVEGVDVRFQCKADANPPDVSYRYWIVKYIILILSAYLNDIVSYDFPLKRTKFHLLLWQLNIFQTDKYML